MKTCRLVPLTAILFLVASLAVGSPPEGELVSRMKHQPVHSTNVASVGYSKKLRALEIEFTRGVTYRFLDVPHHVYTEFLEAGSKGHFIAVNIRGQYRYLRVRPVRKPERESDPRTAD